MSDTVKGLLVTGSEEAVMDFWLPLGGVLNSMDRRKNTSHFTLWNDPPMIDAVVESAERAGISVQEIVGAGDDEKLWRRRLRRPAADAWAVWMYATKPGWERVGTFATREDARQTVRDAIDEGERPAGWAVVRSSDDPAPTRKPPWDMQADAPLDLGVCAYFLGIGTCSFGCRDEPSCQTNEPLEGWPSANEDAERHAEATP